MQQAPRCRIAQRRLRLKSVFPILFLETSPETMLLERCHRRGMEFLTCIVPQATTLMNRIIRAAIGCLVLVRRPFNSATFYVSC